MARRMASWLKVPGIGGDLQWFQQKGDVALMALLWAAAVTGRTILDVYEWVQLHGHATCLEILAEPPGQHPADVRGRQADVRGEPDVGQHPRHDRPDACRWAILPGLAAAVTPPPGRGLQRRGLHHAVRHAVPDRQRRRRLPGDAAVPGAGLLGSLTRPGWRAARAVTSAWTRRC